MTKIDSSYRIGRCRNCSSRPAYAWPAASGLRLDNVRCERCGRLLDRTSREAHNMRILDDKQIVAQRMAAIAHLTERIAELADVHAAWVTEAEVVYPDPESVDHYRCQLRIERYGKSIAAARADLKRLARAQYAVQA